MSNIVVMHRKYADERALDDVINYCYRKADYWFGAGVRCENIETAKESMRYIKKYYRQEDGRQLVHFVINVNSIFGTGEAYSRRIWSIDYRRMDSFAYAVSLLLFGKGYQNCFFYHSNRETPHVHFVLNSVSCKDGRKLREPKELGFEIIRFLKKNYSDCRWIGVYDNNVKTDKYGYQS